MLYLLYYSYILNGQDIARNFLFRRSNKNKERVSHMLIRRLRILEWFDIRYITKLPCYALDWVYKARQFILWDCTAKKRLPVNSQFAIMNLNINCVCLDRIWIRYIFCHFSIWRNSVFHTLSHLWAMSNKHKHNIFPVNFFKVPRVTHFYSLFSSCMPCWGIKREIISI